jgi:hypothetical protein
MEEVVSNVHDEHYRKVEGRGVEPIEVMETIICNGLPAEFHAIAKRNLNIAQANKYFMRLGEKDSPEKELAKARNYLHRAVHGCWEWQEKKRNLMAAEESFGTSLPPGSWALTTSTKPE